MRARVQAFIVTAALLAGATGVYAQSWFEAYQRGMAAVQKRDWPVVVAQMSKAIAEKPQEENLARARRRSVLYVPHFWLGMALIQTGDRSGGQRALQVSEAQGVIQKTSHYAELRAALSGAAADLSRDREKQSGAAKGAADREIGVAMTAQVKATAAGATRTEQFRRASQKLQEGFAARKAADYDGALKSARTASQLFGDSIAAAKRSTARVETQRKTTPPVAVAVPPQEPALAVPQPAVPVPQPALVESGPVTPVPAVSEPAPAAETPLAASLTEPAREKLKRFSDLVELTRRRHAGKDEIESVAQSTAAVIHDWERQLDQAKSPADVAAVEASIRVRTREIQNLGARLQTTDRVAPSAASTAVRSSDLLQQTYMAFAHGDLATADTLAGLLIDSSDKRLEGFMLRACARYTRSLLTKRAELEQAAAADFRAALAISRSATLDPKYFSPKVIAFFQKQRSQS